MILWSYPWWNIKRRVGSRKETQASILSVEKVEGQNIRQRLFLDAFGMGAYGLWALKLATSTSVLQLWLTQHMGLSRTGLAAGDKLFLGSTIQNLKYLGTIRCGVTHAIHLGNWDWHQSPYPFSARQIVLRILKSKIPWVFADKCTLRY